MPASWRSSRPSVIWPTWPGSKRSPNTVRAYAQSLALWLEFLQLRQVGWDSAVVEDVSGFVTWLRAPADNVIVLDASAARRAESTVNRHLAAVFGFYDFHARNGVALAESLVAWRRVPRGSFKPFLHHVTRGRPIPTRPVKLTVPRRLPVALSVEEVAVILAACDRLRDRFLFALLAETGLFSRGQPAAEAPRSAGWPIRRSHPAAIKAQPHPAPSGPLKTLWIRAEPRLHAESLT